MADKKTKRNISLLLVRKVKMHTDTELFHSFAKLAMILMSSQKQLGQR